MKMVIIRFSVFVLLIASQVAGTHGQGLTTVEKPKLLISTGLFVTPFQQTWANVRAGAEGRRNAWMAGLHRLLFYSKSQRFRPWPVGLDFWYRRYFQETDQKLLGFLLVSVVVSRTDVYARPPRNDSRVGAWMYWEPSVGYGFRWDFSKWVSLEVEAGVGLAISQFRPKGRAGDPAYWPAGWMGGIRLEHRF